MLYVQKIKLQPYLFSHFDEIQNNLYKKKNHRYKYIEKKHPEYLSRSMLNSEMLCGKTLNLKINIKFKENNSFKTLNEKYRTSSL